MIETPAEILSHHCTKEAADSFCAWRKKTRKPLTEAAALRIAKTLAAINAAGGDASDALGMAEEHGWQTIKADWYFKQCPGPVKPAATVNKLTFWAQAIKSGKDYLCRNISAGTARQLVDEGKVTYDECKRVNLL